MDVGQSGGSGRRGVFIPLEVLVLVAIVLAAAATGGLVAVIPAVGFPASVAVGMAGLLYGIYTSRRSAEAGPGRGRQIERARAAGEGQPPEAGAGPDGAAGGEAGG